MIRKFLVSLAITVLLSACVMPVSPTAIPTPETEIREMEPAALTHCMMQDGLASNDTWAIAAGPDGSVWVGTNRGVSYYDGQRWVTYTTADGLAGDVVTDIAIDADGAVWFGSENGVARFDGTTWSQYTEADGLASNYVSAVTAAPDGALWFGTEYGVSVLSGGRWKTYGRDHGLIVSRIGKIFIEKSGAVWAWGGTSGIFRFSQGVWTVYLEGGESQTFTDIAASPSGDIYLGLGNRGGGVYQLNPGAPATYSEVKGSPDLNGVLALYLDSRNALWAGAFDGMAVFEEQNWIHYSGPSYVNDIAEAPDGSMWFSTIMMGVFRYLPKDD